MAWVFEMGVSLVLAAPAGRQVGTDGCHSMEQSVAAYCGLDCPRADSVAVILLNPLLQSLLPECLYVITSVLQKGKVRKQ